MKRLKASTMIDNEQFGILSSAYGNKLQEKIDLRFEIMIEDLIDQATKEVDAKASLRHSYEVEFKNEM